MAKALTYVRATKQVSVLDTVNNRISALGGTVVGADATGAFPGRSENLTCVYHGETFFLYRSAANEIRLGKLTGAVWVDVVGFTPITTGSGNLTPIGLWVDQGFMVALAQRSNSVGIDGTLVRFSPDSVVWSAVTSSPVCVTQPTLSQGGPSVGWRNAIFWATAAGIAWAVPGTSLVAPLYDAGSDGGLANAGTPFGSFCFWNNSLYFARMGSIPTLYKLDSNWDPGTPPLPPAWTKLFTVGVPSVGVLSPGGDTGTLCAFVNRLDQFCLLYGGQLGSKLVVSTAATFPAFTDKTSTFLTPPYPSTSDLGFTRFTDDRRRTAEIQSFLIRDVVGNQMTLTNWDGVAQFQVRASFPGVQLMVSDERFGDLRTYTGVQPSCHITGTVQPFPGRVVLSYVVRDTLSRKVDVFGEYSADGDEWFPMSEGDGDSGPEQLTTTPVGVAHTYFWDAWKDVSGDLDWCDLRVVARLSGV